MSFSNQSVQLGDAPQESRNTTKIGRSLIARVAGACFRFVVRFFWKPITVFRVGGVPVQFHSTCVVPILFVLIDLDVTRNTERVLLFVFVFFSMFVLSLLVHEFAHVWVAHICGIGSHRIVVVPTGALVQLRDIPRGGQEFWIAAAGPAGSLVLAGVLWMVAPEIRWSFSFRERMIAEFLLMSSKFNLFIALFNLLPCHPLDGGRMLRSLLTVLIKRKSRLNDERACLAATRIAVRYVAWPVFIGVIVFSILKTQSWFDTILVSIVVAFGEAEYWLLRTEPDPDMNLSPE